MKKERNSEKRGISLIVLIITIIVIIILAVAVILSIANNNPIKNAKEARFKNDVMAMQEELELLKSSNYAKNNGASYNDPTTGNQIKLSDLTSATKYDKKFTVKNEVLYFKRGNALTEDEQKWVKELGIAGEIIAANEPDISELNKNNTRYVSWKLVDNTYQIKEDVDLNEEEPINWYDYTEGINHWANIKTTGGGNDCYWVWIPRYAYCITEGYHSNEAGEVDIKFLEGTTNTPLDGSSITISNSSGAGNWNVHPAFWWDKDNDGVEDEGEQLSGIWVAKFEASSNSSNVVDNPTGADLEIDGGSDTDIDLKIRVKPNVVSWRKITANNIFTVCRNLTTSGNSLENTNNIDAHMMKNIEWGAVAYLSRSVYGKNDEVWNNPYYNNSTSHSPITGLCGNELNGKDGYTTDISKTYKYNEKGGENASTTGNVYGVYDMAGGVWEYVAGIHAGGTSDGNQSQLYDSNNSKYVDKYTSYGTSKYGDAVYETSSSASTTSVGNFDSSWDFGMSDFVLPPKSNVFIRGGGASVSSIAGVFSFSRNAGIVFDVIGFRPVMLNSK